MPGYKGAVDMSKQGLLNIKQAADKLGVSVSTLRRFIKDPQCHEISEESIVYRRGDNRAHYFKKADIVAFRKSNWFAD